MGAKFDISGLDDVIHGRVRLGIVAYLASAEVADFTELKDLLDVTQGNLSVHLRKLEDAGYVAIDKSFVGRKPLTRVRLTEAGRGAFASYLQAMGQLVEQAGKV
ncbi:transcriptional regulator [Caulobacter segnis]|uniref:Transcriptional regulator, ArsR family n=2 Tax=Caulobacter segnis TaxID=88688 RepID=D5VLD2_CAUST|nr:transcriptional regulator [Caulobacter segnis]ADG11305.1 transcriptional regulator, ArsR family [Caulobacter segnis ATCC 21756]AVQ02975.1 transcriptional regulator [Caulobacter segnis]